MQQSREAIYLAQQDAQAKRNLPRPENVVRLPFSHALALVETPLASVNLTNDVTSDDSVTVETLAAAETDLIINNIVVDQDTIASESANFPISPPAALFTICMKGKVELLSSWQGT